MNRVNWRFIINKIREEKCVLMIGPEVSVAHTGKSLQFKLKEYLRSMQGSIDDLVYYSEDEFFSFKDTRQELETYDNICSFYRELKPSDIYEKLSLIPFHVIISLSPDFLLKQTFEAKELDFRFDFYHKKKNPLPLDPPSADIPLVYNLLGCIEDDDSLVYTYNDLFDYLTRILGSHHLPDRLRHALANSKNFIFLGLKYERWYLKLLLRLLDLHNKKQIDSTRLEHKISEDTLTYFSSEFNVNFVDDNILDFVNTLYEKCEEADLLRKPGVKVGSSFRDEIKKLISSNEMMEAFQRMTAYAKKNAPDHYNEILLLYKQFNQVKGELDLGITDPAKAQITVNQVTRSMLELSDQI